MKVTLQNYCRGQTVFHSELVILKGQLCVDPVPGEEDSGGGCASALQSPTGICGGGIGGSLLAPFEFEIWHRRKISGGGAKEEEIAVPHKSYRSRFVCILKLGEGLNQIKFCDKEIGSVFDEFSLKYSPEDGRNSNYIRILNVVSGAKTGSDSEEEQNILPKLNLGLTLVQSLFAEKLYENGFERRSFRLSNGLNSNGMEKEGNNLLCNLFKISLSPEEISQMSTADLWEYIAKEIRGREGVWDPNCKYVGFISNPWKVHYEHHQHHSHNSSGNNSSSNEKLALGGGGLAIIGTSFVEIWPNSVEKILKTVFSERKLWTTELENCAARFGAVNRTEGSLYAASLGSVIHEMGHIFDLGHTDSGLMGNEFNRIDTSLSPVLSYPPVAELFRMKLGADVALMMMLRPKVGLPNGSGCLSEDLLSIGISCATLLYFHKWFQPKSSNNTNGKASSSENIVLLRNKIVSKTSTLVTLQVRDTEDERLLKSWTFVEKTSRDPSDPVALCSTFKEFTLAKNHIPIPVCQRGDSNRALVVAEDCDGNLLKTVVSRDSLSESFTVIRRRT